MAGNTSTWSTVLYLDIVSAVVKDASVREVFYLTKMAQYILEVLFPWLLVYICHQHNPPFNGCSMGCGMSWFGRLTGPTPCGLYCISHMTRLKPVTNWFGDLHWVISTWCAWIIKPVHCSAWLTTCLPAPFMKPQPLHCRILLPDGSDCERWAGRGVSQHTFVNIHVIHVIIVRHGGGQDGVVTQFGLCVLA